MRLTRISLDPAGIRKRPCIGGLHLRVVMILILLASGANRGRILQA